MNKIIHGDALEVLKTLESESIDCVVTSPPYWALRDYGVEGQLGNEPNFKDYISKLCDIFDEIKRVLKKTGTCWVNLGDTYDYEEIFFFVKNKKYFFEMQYEPLKESSLIRSNYSSYSQKTDMGKHGGMTLESQKKHLIKCYHQTIRDVMPELFGKYH